MSDVPASRASLLNGEEPYDGFMLDAGIVARAVVEKAENTPHIVFQAAKRIFDLFEPEKCPFILTIQPVYRFKTVIHCKLPAGHHVFNLLAHPDRLTRTCCDKDASDLIHSPGHVPDVLDEVWHDDTQTGDQAS